MQQVAVKPLLVRAFELARTGQFPTHGELKKVLKKEGYSGNEIASHFVGRGLRQQIKALRPK